MIFRKISLILALLAALSLNAAAQDPFEVIHEDILKRMDEYRMLGSAERPMLLQPEPTPSQADFDVIHYDIDIAVDHIGREVEGRVGILVESLVEGLAIVDLNADIVLEIDSVLVEGQPAALWGRSGDVLQVSLPVPADPGQQVRIWVYYRGLPADAAHPGLFFREYDGNPVIYSLSEPWSARTWYPCKDYPDDKALFDIKLSVDPSFTATSNGILVAESDTVRFGSPYRRYQWRENYPMANYLFSITASVYTVLEEAWEYAPGETMMVTNYVYPSKIAQAEEDFSIQVPALDFFSSIYGLYPYFDEKYGVALCQIGGGMEHQTLTSYGEALTIGNHFYDYIWIHELAHMWFGDLVTCRDWTHIWINEGWASYSEALWFEHLGGPGELHAYMAGKDTPHYWDGGPILRDPSVMDPWYYFNTVVYHKGAWVLHMLRHVMGDPDFFGATRAFLEDPRFRFSNADTDDMREVFESFYGAPLGWFFDQWLLRTDRPSYEITWDHFQLEGSGRLEIAIRQTQGVPYTMPVDLRIYTSSGDVDTVLWVDGTEESFTLETAYEVTGVALDPDGWILSNVTSTDLTGDTAIPSPAWLGQNVPNPFNPVTTISFGLGKESDVRLAVFDVAGRLVRVLTDRVWPAGTHEIVWNGTSEAGSPAASGIYFYRLETGQEILNRKMVLLR